MYIMKKCTTKSSANRNAGDGPILKHEPSLQHANESGSISPSPVFGPAGAQLATPSVKLVAPFPYFGGKRWAAELVWPMFGPVRNYVEPFGGSLALLLAAPLGSRIETINDTNCFIINFWRSIQSDPEGVAKCADSPVSEVDLEARHSFLVNQSKSLRERLHNPKFYDPQLAGWWVWGACCWIGSGWCLGDGPWISNGAELTKRTKFQKENAEIGIRRALPSLGNAGTGIHRRLPKIGDRGRTQFLVQWFRALCDRIRHVRIVCGDFSRVLTSSVTENHGITAVFLDPPYGADSITKGLYLDEGNAAVRVRAWCLANGENPKLRIALCGYEAEHNLPGWTVVAGKANGGYGNATGNINKRRERIWFSPHCVRMK